MLGPIMIGTEYEILAMSWKLKPLVFYDIESEDAYEFILNYYKRLQKLGIVLSSCGRVCTF